jgi:hypothetical protein
MQRNDIQIYGNEVRVIGFVKNIPLLVGKSVSRFVDLQLNLMKKFLVKLIEKSEVIARIGTMLLNYVIDLCE